MYDCCLMEKKEGKKHKSCSIMIYICQNSNNEWDSHALWLLLSLLACSTHLSVWILAQPCVIFEILTRIWSAYLEPDLREADPVDVMCSPGSEGHGEDASVEHFYCRGAVTEVLKYGSTDLHSAIKGPNPPKALILIIPGKKDEVFVWQK